MPAASVLYAGDEIRVGLANNLQWPCTVFGKVSDKGCNNLVGKSLGRFDDQGIFLDFAGRCLEKRLQESLAVSCGSPGEQLLKGRFYFGNTGFARFNDEAGKALGQLGVLCGCHDLV